ncbi:MAG: hypothetical protein ACLSHG_09720 [Oscillospiraceae bacterium]
MMRYYRGIYPKFDAERHQKLGKVFQLDPKRQIRRRRPRACRSRPRSGWR